MHVKILSFNTWQKRGPWQERWEHVFCEVPKLNPDIIGLQEVFDMEHAKEIQKRLDYPYLSVSGEEASGLIFLSRYPVLESECTTLKTKSPSEEYYRYVHFTLFDLGSIKLAGFNTHLTWRVPENEIRVKQVSEIQKFVAEKSAENTAFITGDFNSAPNTEPIENVLKVWKDSYACAHPESQALTWDYKNPFAARAKDEMPERRIDYVFLHQFEGEIVSSEIVLNQPNENGTYASDHFGVMTTIEM